MAEQKKKYTLKSGKFRGSKQANGSVEIFRPGDVVELTDNQAEAFKDLLVKSVAANPPQVVAPESSAPSPKAGPKKAPISSVKK